MTTVIEQSRAEHRNFQAILHLICLHVKMSEPTDASACRFLANAVLYMQEYGDGIHHERDRLLLSKLVAADPSMVTTFQRLQALRQELRHTEIELQRLVARAKGGDEDACEQLRGLVGQYRENYMAYITLEEHVVFPAAQAVFRVQDWKELSERFVHVRDPIFDHASLMEFSSPYDAIMAFDGGALD
ncbi:MAG TPA: hemerythrin domain-containing protein [Gammaproteobacteria bacterium]|nr:hemerythrin domain-containing protein [Gammaproteobacteria bacterium]